MRGLQGQSKPAIPELHELQSFTKCLAASHGAHRRLNVWVCDFRVLSHMWKQGAMGGKGPGRCCYQACPDWKIAELEQRQCDALRVAIDESLVRGTASTRMPGIQNLRVASLCNLNMSGAYLAPSLGHQQSLRTESLRRRHASVRSSSAASA